MCNLTLLGRNGGKRRYLLGYLLAAAMGAYHDALLEIRDVKNLGEFLMAIQAEKNVLRHVDSPPLYHYGSADR
jgi:hypothetical protein